MFGNTNANSGNSNNDDGGVPNAAKAFAVVIGVVIAFFATPPLYNASLDTVASYTANNYGYGWVGIVRVLDFITTAIITFYVGRLVFLAGFTAGWFKQIIAMIKGG